MRYCKWLIHACFYIIIGGEIAAIVMGFVALLTIIIFAVLFVRKRNIQKQSEINFHNPNANIPPPESTHFGGDKNEANAKEFTVESNLYKLNEVENSEKAQYSESTRFGADIKAGVTESNQEFIDVTNTEKEDTLTPKFDVHAGPGIVNAHIESEEQFQF